LARDAHGPVSVAAIRDALGERSLAAFVVLFAGLNLIPAPPGASVILGLPLVIVAAQMLVGAKRAWLPGFILRRSLSAERFRAAMDWILPRLVRLERYVRPRFWPFRRRRGERIVGAAALLLAVVVTLPIPFGAWLPAFATALIALSLIERDGILLTVGVFVGIVSIGIVVAVVGVAGFAAQAALGWGF
ncbi:MAG TPA: exopolysaccharide biosynthesis protein, partial [Rhizobiales bacterium]|nr:exopolysaccharide biosynthesis protein [Hyphomicrobiales bacterium]